MDRRGFAYNTNSLEILDGKSDLLKAQEYFDDNDFDACAVKLRKYAENLIKQLCNNGNLMNNLERGKFKSFGASLKEAKSKIDKESYNKFRTIVVNNGPNPDVFPPPRAPATWMSSVTRSPLTSIVKLLVWFALTSPSRVLVPLSHKANTVTTSDIRFLMFSSTFS